MPAMPGKNGNLMAFAAGAAQVLGQAPLMWWPVGIASALLLLHLLLQLDWKQAFIRGWCFGSGLFLTGASWLFLSIYIYGESPLIFALVVTFGFGLWMGLYLAVFWALFGLTRSHCTSIRCLVAFPACWLLGEWFCSWFATGFPWLFLGYGHIASPLGGWAPVTGVLGVGFAAAMTAAVIYRWRLQRRYLYSSLGILALLWGGGAISQQLEWTRTVDEQPLKIAALQSRIGLKDKFTEPNLRHIRSLYRELTEPLLGKYDLVVWPETAIAGGFSENRQFLRDLDTLAADRDTAILTGLAEREPTGKADFDFRYFNTALVIGQGKGRYRKRHLVPYGEYVPLEALLRGLVPFLDLPLSSFTSGDEIQKPLYVKGARADTFICYEIAYQGLVAESIGEQGFLVTISEDGWFGDSLAPRQHLLIAQMRALETGRDLVRTVTSGISAFIDHKGRIRQRSQLGERVVISDSINVRSGSTPFVKMGSQVPPQLAALMLLILFARRILRPGKVR